MSPGNTPGGRIGWVKISDVDPTMKGVENHFVALDGDGEDIGVVKWIESGPDKGWLWSMTRVHPGKPFLDRSGMEKTRKEAALALVGGYRAFLKWYRIEDA